MIKISTDKRERKEKEENLFKEESTSVEKENKKRFCLSLLASTPITNFTCCTKWGSFFNVRQEERGEEKRTENRKMKAKVNLVFLLHASRTMAIQ